MGKILDDLERGPIEVDLIYSGGRSLRVNEDEIVDVSKTAGGVVLGVALDACYVIAEVVLSKYLVKNDLEVVPLLVVEVDTNEPVVREKVRRPPVIE